MDAQMQLSKVTRTECCEISTGKFGVRVTESSEKGAIKTVQGKKKEKKKEKKIKLCYSNLEGLPQIHYHSKAVIYCHASSQIYNQ